MNDTWLSVLSDLFINLAAGWFGAVLIVPNFIKTKSSKNIAVLTADLIFGILCLVIGYFFRNAI